MHLVFMLVQHVQHLLQHLQGHAQSAETCRLPFQALSPRTDIRSSVPGPCAAQQVRQHPQGCAGGGWISSAGAHA